MAIERIKLNLIPTGTMPVCHTKQYDKGREIGIDLLYGLKPYYLTDEALELDVRKSDNHLVTIDVSYEVGKSSIIFATTEQMCAVSGSNICALKVTKGGVEIGSLNFIMEVEKSVLEGGLPSESDIENLETQMTAIIDPLLDELVPPKVEEIVPQIIGDDYYTAEETDEAIATATEGKADTTYVDTELDKKADKNNTYTKTEVDEKIDALPEPMIFKGTLGVGGTIQTLPTASASNEGWTFKCITAGTYAGLTLKVGDTVTCFNPPNTSNYYWDKTGSQDTDTDTWRNIKVNGVEKLGNGISSGAVDFVGSENIEVEFDANGNKVGIKTKNIYTKNEVDDIVYNILPDDTASGSVANFETDLALPLKSLDVDVNAKQDLHGYAYPWTAGGGKNILLKPFVHYSLAPNNLEDMFFIKAGDYRFSFSDSTATNWRVGMRMKDAEGNDLTDIAYKPNSGMSWRSAINCWLGGSDSTTKSLSITIVEDCYIRMVFGLASTTTDTEFTNVQLEKGTTQTSYEPVENICPIEGWSEVYLKRCKKNWLDKDTAPIVNGYITATDFNTSNYKSRTTYIKIPAGSTFTVTKIASARFTLATAKNPPASGELLTNRLANYSQATKLTITAGSEDRYLWIWFYLYDTDTETYEDVLNSIQVELGSTETEYEPYVGNEYIINLGGTYYGGHFTQDKDGHRQFVVKRRGKKINEFENWYYIGGYAYFECNSPDMKGSSASAILEGLICECYATRTAQQAGSGNVDCSIAGWTYTSTNESRIRIKDNKYSNVTAWLSAVGEYLIIYPLAEPIIIDLPDGEPIATLVGTNNIFADTGDTSVVFKDSVNGYVEKKIASVQALALNT